jgi:hypothetical protein
LNSEEISRRFVAGCKVIRLAMGQIAMRGIKGAKHQVPSFKPQLNCSGTRGGSGRELKGFLRVVFTAVVLLGMAQAVEGVTLSELRADPQLTPERLIKYFADFKFELGRTVRKPESFLAAQAGDCDDFATLAADLLREKGYTTRLVAVFMPKDVHVICYVKETNSYLDYNCRKKPSPLVKCDGELSAIATSVAQSFRTQWRSASEFTMQADGARHFLLTEFR